MIIILYVNDANIGNVEPYKIIEYEIKYFNVCTICFIIPKL